MSNIDFTRLHEFIPVLIMMGFVIIVCIAIGVSLLIAAQRLSKSAPLRGNLLLSLKLLGDTAYMHAMQARHHDLRPSTNRWVEAALQSIDDGARLLPSELMALIYVLAHVGHWERAVQIAASLEHSADRPVTAAPLSSYDKNLCTKVEEMQQLLAKRSVAALDNHPLYQTFFTRDAWRLRLMGVGFAVVAPLACVTMVAIVLLRPSH